MANRNQPIIVNAETKEQADQFITTLGEMFEIIEKLAEDSAINEGNYLILADKFKKLSELKERTKTTVIYVEAQRTHTRGRVATRKPLTKAEKLKDPKFMLCPSCKKVMTKRHYDEKHERSGVCGHIVAVGNLLSHNKAEAKSDGRRVKISDAPIVCEERSLDIHNIKGVKTVDYKTKQTEERSIAHRSLILAELFKPLGCGADGIVNLEVETLVIRDEDDDDEEEDDQYETKTFSFQQFKPDEGKKRWKRNEAGKWRPTITIKKPKAKLVIIQKEEVREEVREEETTA
jgi:hypothetical protein